MWSSAVLFVLRDVLLSLGALDGSSTRVINNVVRVNRAFEAIGWTVDVGGVHGERGGGRRLCTRG